MPTKNKPGECTAPGINPQQNQNAIVDQARIVFSVWNGCLAAWKAAEELTDQAVESLLNSTPEDQPLPYVVRADQENIADQLAMGLRTFERHSALLVGRGWLGRYRLQRRAGRADPGAAAYAYYVTRRMISLISIELAYKASIGIYHFPGGVLWFAPGLEFLDSVFGQKHEPIKRSSRARSSRPARPEQPTSAPELLTSAGAADRPEQPDRFVERWLSLWFDQRARSDNTQ